MLVDVSFEETRFDKGINAEEDDLTKILSKLFKFTLNFLSACKITLYVNPSLEKVVTLFDANNISIVLATDSADTPNL